MFSRTLLLLFGLVLFAGATVLLCVGTSIGLFVAGRILQGMSAAVVWTTGLALLADNVGNEELGKCLGFVSLGMCSGVFLGPLLGGVVYDQGGYYAVYAMAFALIVVDLLLRLIMVEKRVALRYIATADAGDHELISAGEEKADPKGEGAQVTDLPAASGPVAERTRLPPIISLLGSGRILVQLFAAIVFATMMTSFDAVCCPGPSPFLRSV